MVLFSPEPRGIGMFREMGHHMGRVGRNCPMFRCGSADAARLANHLDQVHDIDKEQRAKWLKFGKIGIKPLSPIAKVNSQRVLSNMVIRMKVLAASLRVGFCDEWKRAFCNIDRM